MPSKSLPPHPNLEHLKYQAKDLRIAHQSGNAKAVARTREFHPKFTTRNELEAQRARLSLSDALLVIAREYGFESWPKLKNHVEALAKGATPASSPGEAPPEQSLASPPTTTLQSHAERVAQFLEYACPDHHIRGGAAHRMARHAAERMLRRHPELARENLYTAVVCGELAEVERRLAERPAAATEKYSGAGPDRAASGGADDVFKNNGPKLWEPLLFLCFTRLPLAAASANAVAIARTLLDHGADPNACFMAGSSRYTPLVGVIGEGEEGRAPHPQRDALTRLLLERGAAPYDLQVIYNTHFRGDVLWFLKLIYEQSVKSGRKPDWDDPNWEMLGMGGYGSGARFLLHGAVQRDDRPLAEWLLFHGADPNAAPPSSSHFPKRTLYEEALRGGQLEMARLLARYGAQTGGVEITGEDPFKAACFRLDRAEAERLLKDKPDYLLAPETLMAAAKQDRADVVALLLDLGVAPDLTNPRNGNETALHVAAYSNSPAVAALLLDRGAAPDARESNFGATPLGFAVWGEKTRLIDLLCRFSRDVWDLTFMGKLKRLREVLNAQPELAKVVSSDGETPLMRLPDDEGKALECARLLLSLGADPALKNRAGLTAADLAEKRGLLEAAAALRVGLPTPGPEGSTSPRGVEELECRAQDFVQAYETGDEAALQRLNAYHQRAFTREDLRAEVWRRARVAREASSRGIKNAFGLAQAKVLLAQDAGFGSWSAFTASVATGSPPPDLPYQIDAKLNQIEPRRNLSARDWETIVAVMRERQITALSANGQMTDAAMDRVAELGHVTRLTLGGSRQLTDDGLLCLARMPQLEYLHLSENPGGRLTDRGLEALRHLPQLKTLQMTWQKGITDAGVAHLACCDQIENVNLMGTPTGDGALRALRGKTKLRYFQAGKLLTDAGLPLLHEIPAFKTWQGGELKFSLLNDSAEPNNLLLDGPITNAGLAALAGLDGLFGLRFFWHLTAVTPDCLQPLASLPNLGVLGWGGALCDDTAMRHIAALPRLRMLMAQGTVATDAGFESLSRSTTLAHFWGRECPNLTGRGFIALSKMPALRALSVSCKNVDDAALSTLPEFPALAELTPIDVSDAGFRYVGLCQGLEGLSCMYCRDTTDVATEHLLGLSRLKTYYAGATKITDRSLELLSRISSLEQLAFYECLGISDAGLPFLARLPRLREADFSGSPNVTLAGTRVFPNRVRVKHTL